MWEKFSCLLLRTELQGRRGSLLLLQALIKGKVGGTFPDMEVVSFKTSYKSGDLRVAANIGLTGMSGATWL